MKVTDPTGQAPAREADERQPYEAKAGATFQPRIEAEEGEPTRFDYVVLVLVLVLLVVAFLWAFGVIAIPLIPL